MHLHNCENWFSFLKLLFFPLKNYSYTWFILQKLKLELRNQVVLLQYLYPFSKILPKSCYIFVGFQVVKHNRVWFDIFFYLIMFFLAIVVEVIRFLYAVMSLLTCKKNPIVCRVSSVKCTCYAWLLSFVQIVIFWDVLYIFTCVSSSTYNCLPTWYKLGVSSYLPCCVFSNALRYAVQKFTCFAHCR
jgi:hypothetical protein